MAYAVFQSLEDNEFFFRQTPHSGTQFKATLLFNVYENDVQNAVKHVIKYVLDNPQKYPEATKDGWSVMVHPASSPPVEELNQNAVHDYDGLIIHEDYAFILKQVPTIQ